jgi:hypothetical protein
MGLVRADRGGLVAQHEFLLPVPDDEVLPWRGLLTGRGARG